MIQQDLLLTGLSALCAAAWMGGALVSRRRASQANHLTPDQTAGRWALALLLLAGCGSGLLSLLA